MQVKLIVWIIVLGFFISAAGIVTFRALNRAPIFVSDASYGTLLGNSFYERFLSKLSGSEIIVLQVLEMLVIFISVFLILEKLGKPKKMIILSFLLLCFNPVTMWYMLAINMEIFVLMCLMVAVAVFLYSRIPGILLSLALIFIQPFAFFVFMLIVSVLTEKKLLMILSSLVLAGLSFGGFHNFIFEFGSLNGISFSILVLAVLGAFYTKDLNPVWYLLFIFLVFRALAGYHPLLLIPVVYLASDVLYRFVVRKWSSSVLKKMAISFIFLSLLLPFAVSSQKLISSPPDFGEYETLAYLGKMPQGNVLSPPGYDNAVMFLAGKKPVHNEKLFSARELNIAKRMLKGLRIKYIWLNPAEKSRIKDALGFLMHNNETFKKLYSKNGYSVWKVICGTNSH